MVGLTLIYLASHIQTSICSSGTQFSYNLPLRPYDVIHPYHTDIHNICVFHSMYWCLSFMQTIRLHLSITQMYVQASTHIHIHISSTLSDLTTGGCTSMSIVHILVVLHNSHHTLNGHGLVLCLFIIFI